MVLNILIFTFFSSRREDRRFWKKWWQALRESSLLLIYSWIKLWFITVIPKYLNHDTFSNYLFAIFKSRFFHSVSVPPGVPAPS
jgi:hypothetical protein